MKKTVLFLLMVAMILPIIAACSPKGDKSPGKNQNLKENEIVVYFRDAEVSELASEKRTVENGLSAKEKAVFAVKALIKGPEEDNHKAVISKDANLINLEIEDKVATVNISKHYSDKKGTDEILLRRALIETLCSIDGIDEIVINVDGEYLIGPIGPNDYVDPENAQKESIKLYFPNSDGTALGSEIREVEIQNTPSLEKAVVNELIEGPTDKSLSKIIPEGTKLLGIETKDKICYVNFSKEFVNNSGSGSYETTMILYSVVNSLCELDTVDSVQILIEGKSDAEFGNFVFDSPHDPNYDYCE